MRFNGIERSYDFPVFCNFGRKISFNENICLATLLACSTVIEISIGITQQKKKENHSCTTTTRTVNCNCTSMEKGGKLDLLLILHIIQEPNKSSIVLARLQA